MFESRVLPVTRSIGERFDRLSFRCYTLFSFWRPERVVEPTDRHRPSSVPQLVFIPLFVRGDDELVQNLSVRACSSVG